MPRPTPPPAVRLAPLGDGVVVGAAAGVVVGLLDALVAVVRGASPAVLVGASLTTTVGAAAGSILGLLAIAACATSAIPAAVVALRVGTVLALLGPPALLAADAAALRTPRLSAAALAVVLAAVGLGITRDARRAPGAAMGAVGGATAALQVSLSLNLAERTASPLFLGLALALHAGTAAFAFAVGTLVAGLGALAKGSPRTSAVVIGGGVALTTITLFAVPATYATLATWLLVQGFAASAAGFAGSALLRRRGLRRVVGGAVAMAAAGAGYLLLAAPAPSRAIHAISTRTLAMRTVLVASGASDARTARMAAQLRARPAWNEGRMAPSGSRAWNQVVTPASAARSVVLITIDTLRQDAVGYAAARDLGTPHIDALASRATRFRRSYAQGGWTSLSVASLLWSRYPSHLVMRRILEDGMQRLVMADAAPPGFRASRAFSSPRDEPSRNVAEVMREQGIRAVAVLNDGYTSYFEPELGFSRGFDELHRPAELGRGETASERDVDDSLATALAVDVLRRSGTSRFFLWVHLFGPHLPHAAAHGGDYAGEVRHVDAQVGAIIDALAAAGRAEDTAIVLTADHGEAFGEHGDDGHGNDLFEESLRVPLLVHVPSGTPRDVEAEVGLIDVAPTILEVLGVAVPSTMQGYGLRRVLEGGEPPRARPVFFETWRAQPGGPRLTAHLVGVVRGGTKVIHDRITGSFGAYDLARDPGERNDLGGVAFGAETHADLAALLLGWVASADDPR